MAKKKGNFTKIIEKWEKDFGKKMTHEEEVMFIWGGVYWNRFIENDS